MENNMNFYKKELEILKDSIYNKTIKISDGIENTTKTLSLNKESIPILMDWLATEFKRLQMSGERRQFCHTL